MQTNETAEVIRRFNEAFREHDPAIFEVNRDATKTEIRSAVQKLFKVKVADVQTTNTLGKLRRRGKFKRLDPPGALFSEESRREAGPPSSAVGVRQRDYVPARPSARLTGFW